MHYCLSDDYPSGRITCLCSRGVDHAEELFDVPVGQEPQDDE